jgi:hypothetical protein
MKYEIFNFYSGFKYYHYLIKVEGKDYHIVYVVDEMFNFTEVKTRDQDTNILASKIIDTIIHFDKYNIEKSLDRFEKLSLLK